MKNVVALGMVVLLGGVASGQERIPPDDAQKYARLLVDKTAKAADLQLRLEPDADKPFGLKHDEFGVLIIPAKSLSEKSLEKVGKDVQPVGQLWARNLTLMHKDKAVANDKLRLVKINIEDQDHSLPFFLVGVRKKADANLELVVYAKDKEPLLAVPLKKVETKQELPIELEGKNEDDRGTVTLNILGKYQAQLVMTKQEE